MTRGSIFSIAELLSLFSAGRKMNIPKGTARSDARCSKSPGSTGEALSRGLDDEAPRWRFGAKPLRIFQMDRRGRTT